VPRVFTAIVDEELRVHLARRQRMPSWRLSYGSVEGGVERKLDCILQSISCRYVGKAIKRLHGANCAKAFGISEAE
jgi:hypothetical protein